MDKHSVAIVLDEIGTLLELNGEDSFKVRAYSTAARALDSLEGEPRELLRSGELENTRGFGPATISVVRELVDEGASRLHHELRERTPAGLLPLLNIPGLGAKRVYTLSSELDIISIDDLEDAARAGRVADVAGFGPKTQDKILAGISFLREIAGRRLQPGAFEAARRVTGALEDHPSVERIALAGALRRRVETVDCVDVIAASTDCGAVLGAFEQIPGTVDVERSGPAAAMARLADGFGLRLRCVMPAEFAVARLYATGSDAHIHALAARAAELGMRLDERGLWRDDARIAAADEPALYEAIELQYVPPELRDGAGSGQPAEGRPEIFAADDPSVAAAASGTLPRLVELSDLRGTFHCHTTYSDGKATLTEMAHGARERGWRYLGIADHSRAAAYAGGLSVAEIARQHDEIDAWNAEHGHDLWLFKGVEADILADGQLDYAGAPDDVLASFDYVVASIHSSFQLSRTEMTARMLRALDDPHITFLGHATGRLLLRRDGYDVDLEMVIEHAAENGVGIEINADPRRLELDWRHWRHAAGLGVLTAVNPDAHSVAGLDNVSYGVGVARKGWLASETVVNTWELDAVKQYFGMADGGVD